MSSIRRLWFAAFAAVLVGAYGADATAATLLVDDFASHFAGYYIVSAVGFPFLSSGQPVEHGGLPTTLGGERDWAVVVMGEPTIQSAQLTVGIDLVFLPTGGFHISTPADSPGSATTLQYDGDDIDGDSLVNAELLDVAIPANGAFEIDFLWIDAPESPEGLRIDMQLTSVGGGEASFGGYVPRSIAAPPSPYTFVAQLDDFSRSVEFDPGHISSITYVFNSDGRADTDFMIDNLRAVPEPGAGSLFATGLLFSGAWLRRGALVRICNGHGSRG